MTLNDFLRFLAQQNRSQLTLKNYQRDLERFLGFLLVTFPDIFTAKSSLDLSHCFQQWAAIERTHLQAYLARRSQSGIHPRSIARELSALRSALNFFLQKGIVWQNVAKGIKAPKAPQPLPKSIDVDQTGRLLDTHPDKEQGEKSGVDWLDVRDQAIFELLYSAGLRVSECANLDFADMIGTYQEGWVKVLGKGRKERFAPVGSKAQFALTTWLNIRFEHAQSGENALFVNRSGRRLSVRSMQLRLDKRAELAGLPTKVSPHRLRHACATHVLESSGDLRAVQEMLGHANLSTTQIYTKLDLQHLAKVYDAAHPRAKAKK